MQLNVKPLYTELTAPVDMVFSKYTYIADQAGQIIAMNPETKVGKVALDLAPRLAKLTSNSWFGKPGLSKKYDERGLLGITLHPDFPQDPRIYVYYSHPKKNPGFDHTGRLSVFKFSDWGNIDLNSEKVLFEVDQEAQSHNGGGLHFGPDGYLYLSLGDGLRRKYEMGEMGHAQNVATPKGAILRIDVSDDTAVAPPDNPLVGYPKAHPLIWVWGLRNPWRFSFDTRGRCFVGNVGEHAKESVHIVNSGDNCGWRIYEGSKLQDPLLAKKLKIDTDTLNLPIFDYGPELGRCIAGGYVYRGNARPDWRGLYIFADASTKWPWRAFFQGPNGAIYALKETAKKWERINLKINGLPKHMITSLAEDPSGELYILTRRKFGAVGKTGAIFKLV